MHRESKQSPARVLAPLSLAVCSVAFLFVLFTSGSGDDGNSAERSAERSTNTERTQTSRAQRRRRTSYTVKTGDTLAAIAEKVDLSVERLQELNPELDPQALVSGQKIKLRE